ncbi:phosphotyrosine protein phosphatase I superfamily [Elsinoe ampelina]|uniref:Phosphotyrosine protein phosphatase I superfamily n=1 Tax=Elsinoe ampelina TaxID=302913 RepID=A0A6A6GE62_9PEZI|nr:phosphotyrosine protein phosphatase I superfamily [Elsinoe ampelina]
MASDKDHPVSVLFVCLGNICRSPMAEGVFRHLTNFERPNQDPRIKHVDSCGTGAYHTGDSPDPRTVSVLEDHGITEDYYQHAARKFHASDFNKFDYIFAMDKENQSYLDRERGRLIRKGDLDEAKAGKVELWGKYGGRNNEEVIDPYYGARNGFEIAYEQMVRFTNGFMKQLGKEDS